MANDTAVPEVDKHLGAEEGQEDNKKTNDQKVIQIVTPTDEKECTATPEKEKSGESCATTAKQKPEEKAGGCCGGAKHS